MTVIVTAKENIFNGKNVKRFENVSDVWTSIVNSNFCMTIGQTIESVKFPYISSIQIVP